jgi:hypothetical protein
MTVEAEDLEAQQHAEQKERGGCEPVGQPLHHKVMELLIQDERQEKLRQELREGVKRMEEHQRIENPKVQEEQKELRGKYEAESQRKKVEEHQPLISPDSPQTSDRPIVKDDPKPIAPRGEILPAKLTPMRLVTFTGFLSLFEAAIPGIILIESEVWEIRCLAVFAYAFGIMLSWYSLWDIIKRIKSKKEIPPRSWFLHILYSLCGWICTGLLLLEADLPSLVRWSLFPGVWRILLAAGLSFVQDVKW